MGLFTFGLWHRCRMPRFRCRNSSKKDWWRLPTRGSWRHLRGAFREQRLPFGIFQFEHNARSSHFLHSCHCSIFIHSLMNLLASLKHVALVDHKRDRLRALGVENRFPSTLAAIDLSVTAMSAED